MKKVEVPPTWRKLERGSVRIYVQLMEVWAGIAVKSVK